MTIPFDIDTANPFHKVFKNSFILTFLRIIEPLLAMVVIIAISRLMGTEVMGGYSFIITFIAMFSVIGQMGLQTLLTREVAANKNESSSYLSAAMFLGLCSSILLAFVMNVSKGYFGLSREVSFGVTVMSLNLFPIFVIATFEAVFMGFERTDLIVYQHLTGNLVRVVLSLIFIWQGLGLVSLVVAIVASTLVSVLVSIFTYFKHLGKIRFKVNPRVSLRLLKSSPTFLLITLVWIMWARLDMLFLTKLTNMTQVALYAAAFKLFEATMIIPQSYMKASFPHLSALYRSGPDFFQETNRDMLKHVLFYVFPTTALVLVLSPLLISILYGDKFSSSAVILQILVIGLVPWTMGRTFANIIVATNHQRYDLWSGVCAALINVGFNLWAIPIYGAKGAAMASVASLVVFFLCQLYFSRRAGYSVSMIESMKLPLLVGGIMLVIVWIARLGWPYACAECGLFFLALGFYVRRSGNRRSLRKPLVLLQNIMRA